MSRAASTLGALRVTAAALLADDRGHATTNMLGFTMTWFTTMFVFLMNVQLGQLFYRRDVVDHAAAVATDTATKTYCQKNESAGATEAAAKKSIRALEETAGMSGCKIQVSASGGGGGDEGQKELEVSLECSFDCKIPIASQFMCKGGKASFTSKQKTVATGCDGKGS